MKRMLTILFAAVLLTGGLSQSALAALGAVGPVNPANGFPLWYQDQAGLRLDLCLDQNGFCLTEEPDTGAPISFPNNFGPEAFWWAAEADFADTAVGGTGLNGLLVLAMEATAADEVNLIDAVEGQQVAFARIRIRVDVPEPGTYTVTHPFGTATYVVPDAIPPAVFDGTRAINETQDIGNFLDPGRTGDFTLALADGGPPVDGARVNADGRSIGPFLTAVGGNVIGPAPDNFVYLANPAVPTQVVGGPNGNVFTVTGPTGTVSTNLFSLMGKVSVNQPPAVNRAEYRVKTGKFHVQGFSAAVESAPGVATVITIHLGVDAAGPVIGTATVDAVSGLWSFNGKAPVSPGGADRTVAIVSSADPAGAPAVLGLTLR